MVDYKVLVGVVIVVSYFKEWVWYSTYIRTMGHDTVRRHPSNAMNKGRVRV